LKIGIEKGDPIEDGEKSCEDVSGESESRKGERIHASLET